MKTLFDKDFKYKPAIETDIRKTFERIRREQLKRLEDAANEEAALAAKVETLPRRKA